MKIPFYILGLLQRHGPQHGYRLKQIIEEQIADFARIKLPSVYYHLGKLKEKGHVEEKLERDGNRPEKSVYTVSEKGKLYFTELLEQQLEEPYETDLPLDGVLFFLDKMPSDRLMSQVGERIVTLNSRLKSLKEYKNTVLAAIPEVGKVSTQAIFNHHIYHYEAELAWLKELEKEKI